MGAFSVFVGQVLPEILQGIWRPPQWGTQPQYWSMTVTLPAQQPNPTNNNVNLSPAPPAQSPTTYFFDAMLRADHNHESVMTEHPVQVGPALVDHMYDRPNLVTLEILMSNVTSGYLVGQYSSVSSRAVAAFNAFDQIRRSHAPITLATRLFAYQNVQIVDLRATDTYQTADALRCIVYFKQIISATVSMTTVSGRPNATNSTNEGTKIPAPPSISTLNGVDSIPTP
jgi:hypothetical protein